MPSFLRNTVGAAFLGLLALIQGTVVRSLKIEALRLYVKAIAVARQCSILGLLFFGFLLLAASAFVMIHAGVLILLPYSLETKGWIILALGIIYGLICFCFVRAVCSEKTWLERSKASEMINDLLKK